MEEQERGQWAGAEESRVSAWKSSGVHSAIDTDRASAKIWISQHGPELIDVRCLTMTATYAALDAAMMPMCTHITPMLHL